MNRRSLRSFSFLLPILLSAWMAAPATAGTLIGSATLDNPDDLTIILTDGGDRLEFLDLPVTQGNSVAAAVAAYSPRGFRWADGTEVSELFDAFGISYAVTSQDFTSLGLATTSTEATNFLSYLGTTQNNAALGWIDDLTTTTYHTYACISVASGCNPAAFTNNVTFAWPADDAFGVYLVRDVPEPGALALLGAGLIGTGWSRRRRGNG